MGVAKGLLAGLLLALSTTASADITFPPAGIVAEPMKRQLAAGEQTLHAVRVDPRIFEAARPGQMLALPGTGGRPVLARHERGVVHDGGVRTWIGTVETATGPQRRREEGPDAGRPEPPDRRSWAMPAPRESASSVAGGSSSMVFT